MTYISQSYKENTSCQTNNNIHATKNQIRNIIIKAGKESIYLLNIRNYLFYILTT